LFRRGGLSVSELGLANEGMWAVARHRCSGCNAPGRLGRTMGGWKHVGATGPAGPGAGAASDPFPPRTRIQLRCTPNAGAWDRPMPGPSERD